MKLTAREFALIATATTSGIFIITTIVLAVLLARASSVTTQGSFTHIYTGGEEYEIAIINRSTLVNDDEVGKAINACQKQIDNDFYPIWGISATLKTYSVVEEPNIPTNSFQLVLIDSADVADALGYHTLTNAGMPVAKVFIKTTRDAGIPWTLTLSHEVLEIMVDPWASITAFVQSDNAKGMIVSYEVADACQSPEHGYEIDGILVSDFVYPAWFFTDINSKKYDHMGYLNQPLAILPGGYMMIFRVPNNGSGWEIINGNQSGIKSLKSLPPADLDRGNGFMCERLKIKHKKKSEEHEQTVRRGI